MNSNESLNSCCNKTNSNIKNFMSDFPLISTGIILGSALTTASLFSPKIRKITVPLCKSVTKHQLKFFAGLGILSVANHIATNYATLDDSDEIIL